MILGLQESQAQTYSSSYNNIIFGNHTVTDEGSDYYVKFSRTSFTTNASSSNFGSPCDCNGDGLTKFEIGTVQGYNNRAAVINTTDIGNTQTLNVGPGYSQTMYLYAEWDGQENAIFNCIADCDLSFASASGFLARTQPIKAPATVTASTDEAGGSTLDKIKINWTKGSDIPEANLGYKVYRRTSQNASWGNPIATLSGSTYTYTDAGRNANTNYYYQVRTYTTDWGGHTSSGTNATGKTLDPMVAASDGDFKTRIKISWAALGGVVDNIRVERSAPGVDGSYEELGILNKNATAYNDYDAIPGALYYYKITFLNANGADIESFKDAGHMIPNGIIKGRIVSTGGAGVQGITVTASLVDPLTGTQAPAPGVNGSPYTETTDVGGYFEFRNVYYYDSAKFVIKPFKSGHGFTPDSLTRILDLAANSQSNVDFIDTTALTVAGVVSYLPNSQFQQSGQQMIGTGLTVENAKILIDGQDYGIRTLPDGSWSYALSDSNTYVFSVEYLDHTFATPSRTENIASDVFNIDFTNTQVDSVKVLVQGGCSTSVSNPVNVPLKVQIKGEDPNQFTATYTTDASGFAEIVLPATKFDIAVVNENLNPNAWDQYKDTIIPVDLVGRDSSEIASSDTVITIVEPDTVTIDGVVTYLPGDTTVTVTDDTTVTYIQPSAEFIYYRSLVVSIDFDAAGAEVSLLCNDPTGDPYIFTEQGVKYPLAIDVVESVTGCPVEEGEIRVYDFVGDREQSPTDLTVIDGKAKYVMQAGNPNLASGGNHPYQKLLYLKVTAGIRPSQAFDYWSLVEGAAQLAPTFSTRSPELPDLILHDPPGDRSYMTVEEGSVFNGFEYESYEISGQGGVYFDQTFGTAIKTPFSENKLGIQWVFELNAGRENFNRSGYSSSLTFTDAYSTSDDPIFTGNDGDVYIGKATNQQFAIAKILTYDEGQCLADVADEAVFYPTGIATTFVYTEKHIRDILIPQLEYLEEVLREAALDLPTADSLTNIHEADSFNIDVLNWQMILDTNEKNRNADAVQEYNADGTAKNVSFSAGAAIDRVESRDSTWTVSYDYTSFIDVATQIGGKFAVEGGAWSDNTVGVAAKFRHSYTNDSGVDTTDSRTVSYHLEDDDFGDFFSVDILRDKAYDVPAFRVFSGTSSCPHEPGTQPRDSAEITITPPEVFNVPIGGQAVFTANLTNYSNSQETREYHVRVVSTSNPDGAIIKLNGQLINHKEASFFINAFQTVQTYLTVERGPVASEYTRIGIMMYPPCEYELWQNNGAITQGDTAWISVSFETECSDVTLTDPGDNWLVNQNSNNILPVTFSGYDLNNPFLEQVALQYKQPGEAWLDVITISADSMLETFYLDTLDVSALENGNYSLRAKSICGSGRGVNYSDEYNGVIDRGSVAPFGTPTPSDGFLRFGQDISITFDKPINCNLNDYATDSISLIRSDDSTEIAFEADCNGTTIILDPDDDLFLDPTLDGVLIHAYVGGIEGTSGNVQEYPAIWSFEVSVSPVFWDPESISRSVLKGDELVIAASLKNESYLSEEFTITAHPDWLIPTTNSGVVLSNSSYELPLWVNSDLDPGTYNGVVTAMVDGVNIDLDVSVTVLAIAPTWSVNPSDYEYSMTMVLQFSLDQGNTQLSTDTRDLVAAYVNGDIRGVGQLEYVADLGIYVAFMTVYSNNSSSSKPDELTFHYWQAYDGQEFGIVEKPDFIKEGNLGTLGSPYILHPEGIVQTIPLKEGWNWVSFNVQGADMDIEEFLYSLDVEDSETEYFIKRKDGKSAEFKAKGSKYEWKGSLKDIDNNQGYLLYVDGEPDTLRVIGSAITPAPFEVESGWNWIGFQPQRPKTTSEALGSLSPTSGDMVKSIFGFDEYIGASNTWYGNLELMEPGSAYKLLLANDDTLYYPQRQANEFVVDHERFENNMVVVAKIGFEDLERINEDRFVVGAFVDGECRGIGELEYDESLGEYRVFLPVHGNIHAQGMPVTYKVLDLKTDIEYVSTAGNLFEVDLIEGSVDDPFILFENLNIQGALHLYQNEPNPFEVTTELRFFLLEGGHTELTIMDATGRVVANLVDEDMTNGIHEVSFTSENLAPGVYFARLIQGDERMVRKMILTGN
ncbi:T9SS type A sorting domain-containing protein [Pontibacter sp. G13]|uniref:T9SS type A sorting domain-containing protein n=1 Tax=Pontibacter sp. G13 TaxID=3074898 RepID=UPI00288C3166|nr:T9SS type A sorting domain-containing protein [Pontibacter sp. G13]WNJ20087.1 T9SS type A sorting domain-containing protein [Pontibacter sp. G13]